MNTEAIYHTLCRTADPAAALAKMQDATLAALITELQAGGVNGGVPALVLGMAELEAVTRWMADRTTAGAVGEGAL